MSSSGTAEIGFDSPVGPLTVRERDGAIVAVAWGKPASERETSLLASAKAQLDGYFFCGLRRFELPVQPKGTDFDLRVFEAMRGITYGTTLTYGEIAASLGGTARDVGTACARNPIPIIIPCHRVVGSGGALVGYSGAGGLETKQALLSLEGVLLPF
jgi:methylated-DNA-[protein]-cysteine S-methyltransferase